MIHLLDAKDIDDSYVFSSMKTTLDGYEVIFRKGIWNVVFQLDQNYEVLDKKLSPYRKASQTPQSESVK